MGRYAIAKACRFAGLGDDRAPVDRPRATPERGVGPLARKGGSARTAIAVAATATAAAVAPFHRARFVDDDLARSHRRLVQARDRRCRVGVVGHFDEAEPLRLAGELVADHLGAGDLSERLEELAELILGHG